MKPSTELFDLIQSLSKSEKRFFKLSSNLQSGEKNYLKLFDVIEKMTEYNEQTLKDQLTGERFLKHLPSEKNHLYKLILKSLRSFHADNSISSILRQEIKNIEILYKKALFSECNKFVSRAKQLAKENEKFYYWFELISWEKQLLEEAYESGDFDKDLDALIQEETEVIEKLRNVAEYQILYSRINYVFRRGGFARNTEDKDVVEQISDYHLIKGKNTALSARASSICYYIKGLCAATNRNYPESYTNFKRVKEILDKNLPIRADIPSRYILAQQHLIYSFIDSRNYNESFRLIKELRDMQNEPGFDTIASKVRIFTTTYLAELITYIRMGAFSEAMALMDDIMAGMSTHGEKISKEQEVLFAYYIASAYFGAGEFNKALFWINKVMNDNEQQLRQDIYSSSRLLNLVIHYELGNYDLLEYIIKSTFRYLNKSPKDYRVDNLILKHIRKLARLGPPKDHIKVLKEMRQELVEVFENPSERVVLDYFDFIAWLEGHINNTTMGEAVVAMQKGN
jgi:hypothetical protein